MISIQSKLPSIDTSGLMSAQRNFKALEVKQSEIINCEQFDEISGLKSISVHSYLNKLDKAVNDENVN
jgi:hypothetical protein